MLFEGRLAKFGKNNSLGQKTGAMRKNSLFDSEILSGSPQGLSLPPFLVFFIACLVSKVHHGPTFKNLFFFDI